MTHARHDVARRGSSRSGFGKWRRGLALSALLLLPILGSGCEDDSDLGLTSSCITFVPDAEPTDGEVVAQRSATSTCEVVVVELVVTGVDDVHSANFKMTFPNEAFFLFPLDYDNDGNLDTLDVTSSFLGDERFTDLGLIPILVEEPPDSGIAVGGVTRVGTREGTRQGVTPDDTNNSLFKVAFRRFIDSGSG